MKVYSEGRVPLKVWTDDAEEGALEQARNLANLPFAHHHVALMPDTHQGYGMPIGGVLATIGVVIPHAVGVDIGCGMQAWPADTTEDDFMAIRDAVMNDIQRSVPTGFNHHRDPQGDWRDEKVWEFINDAPGGQVPIVNKEYQASLHQIGTLGGGNHFIEAQADDNGQVWFMLHSGSRNIGFKVAKHYNEIAKMMNTRWHSAVPKEHDLAFLPLDTDAGQAYLAEMNICLRFAFLNRQAMMYACQAVLERHDISSGPHFDVHHNYAVMENHFGKNVMVHRKGAVRARKDEIVIIPGSMGTSSYIAAGRGNAESFTSCSHGAGRTMGRKAALKAFSCEGILKEMKDADISLFKPKKGDVAEECRWAYKDIDVVMANQYELVEVQRRLHPLAVIKA